MLLDRILECWREASGLDEVLAGLPEDVSDEALGLIHAALDQSGAETESHLAGSSPRVRQAMATGLLLMALEQRSDPKLAVWCAGLAAQAAAGLELDTSGLLGVHAEYLLACAVYLDGNRSGVEARLAEAERHYQAASSDATFPALTACTLAFLALKVDDVQGSRIGIPGAREAFERAWKLAEAGRCHPGLTVVRQEAERLLTQWGWVGTLLESPDPERDLEQWASWVDLGLADLLRNRMRRYAASGEEISLAYRTGELADRVLRRLGEPAEVLQELTLWLMGTRKLEEAGCVLEWRLEGDPENRELQRHLAHVYVDEARYAEALPLLGDLVDDAPDDLYVRSMAATCLWQLGNLLAAYHEFSEVLRLDPNDAITRDMVRKLRPAACVEWSDGQVRYHPDVSLLSEGELKAAVIAAMFAGHPEKLEEGLQNLSTTDPDLMSAVLDVLITRGVVSPPEPEGAQQHLQRAEDHFARGEWAEAAGAYEAAIQEDPNLAAAYMGLGDVHYREGRFYLARAFFEESIAVEPSPLACRFLGDTLRHQGKPEQAVDYYRQALQLLPGYSGAAQALQQVEQELLQSGKLNRAAKSPDEEPPLAQEPLEQLLDLYAARFEPRTPGDLAALERGISQQLPLLGKALRLPTLAERTAAMRWEASPRELEQSILSLTALGFFYLHQAGRPETARELCEFRLALAEELGRQRAVRGELELTAARHRADALQELASFSSRAGRLTEALELCRTAERAFDEDAQERKKLGLPPFTEFDRRYLRHDPRVLLYRHIASVLEQLGDADGSREYGERAVALDRQHPSIETQIEVHHVTGRVALEHGHPDDGLRALWCSLDLALEDRMSRISSRHVAVACHSLGQAHASLGLARMARHWLERALDLNRRSGHRERLCENCRALQELFTLRPDLGDAASAAREAASLAE